MCACLPDLNGDVTWRCQWRSSKQTSVVFSSDLVPKSLKNLHPKKFRRAKRQALVTFSGKPRSLSGQQIWKPGGLHICKSGLGTPTICHWESAGMVSCQSSLHPPHTRLPAPPRDEVCLKRVRQRPPILSWHRKFIAVRYTNRILQERGGQGLKHSGDTSVTRMGAKNPLLLACCPRIFKCKQSQTRSASAHSTPH